MERKSTIDVLRIISCIAVVAIHVISPALTYQSEAIDNNVFINLKIIHSLLLWCVPVFFMITGYCSLMKSECTYKYCFSHILKFIYVLFTIGLFYAFLEEIFVIKTINFSVILNSFLNVISGNLWDHMWYIYSAIGIYLVMPVIHSFMQKEKKNILILTGLLFFFTILFPTFEDSLHIGIDFPFGGYLFYVCFGGLMAKIAFKKSLLYILYFLGILSAIYIFIFAITPHSLGYKNLFVCLIAASIFSFVASLPINSNRFISILAKCTWGVYLIHPLFINLFVKLFNVDLVGNSVYWNLFLFIIFFSSISFISVYFLKKIPIIKQLF